MHRYRYRQIKLLIFSFIQFFKIIPILSNLSYQNMKEIHKINKMNSQNIFQFHNANQTYKYFIQKPNMPFLAIFPVSMVLARNKGFQNSEPYKCSIELKQYIINMIQRGYQKIKQLEQDTILYSKFQNDIIIFRICQGIKKLICLQYEATISSLKNFQALELEQKNSMQSLYKLLKSSKHIKFDYQSLQLLILEPYADKVSYLAKIKFYRCRNHSKDSTKSIKKVQKLVKECRNDKLTTQNIGGVFESFIQILSEISQNIEQLMEEKKFENNEQIETDLPHQLKEQFRQPSNFRPLEIKEFLSLDSLTNKDLSIQSNAIKNKKSGFMKIYSKMILEKNSCYLFKFSEIKVDVGLGIADKIYPKRGIIYSSKGFCFGLEQYKKDDGFLAQEEVIMLVNLNLGQIQWRVNNKTRKKVYHKSIRDPRIQWVVTLYLSCENDSVKVYQ